MFIKKIKNFNFILPIVCFCMLLLSWAGVKIFLPNEIQLIQGREHNFAFGVPLQAQIIEEDIGVLRVNHEPVENNIHIDLSEPFTVKPDHQGKAEVSLSLFGVVPVKTVNAYVLPDMEVVPCGKAVGVSMDTEGIMVLGTGFVSGENNEIFEPSKGVLKSGDMILQAEGKSLNCKEDLIKIVETNGTKSMKLLINRRGEKQEVKVTPVFSNADQCCKIGVWVRDSTQGIGTVTYYDQQTSSFGALGHGVYDIDTKQLMKIRQGNISESSISTIKKGEKGIPGELSGNVGKENILGNITQNTEVGLYGKVRENKKMYFGNKSIPIGLQHEVHEGKASILSNIEGNEVKEYTVEIEKVSHFNNNESKSMILKITDEELLSKTGGIVQGMSGSPIIQDGKLIGAVTHVFVQKPEKGYGIFIENMIKQQKSVA